MPIAPNPSFKPSRALIIGMVALLLGIGVVAALIFFSERGDVEVSVGDSEFTLGKAEDRIKEIEEDGPILIADPNESNASIWVQFLPDSGWTAFRAHRDRCAESLKWEAVPKVFTDPCDETGRIIINANGCLDVVLESLDVVLENGDGGNGLNGASASPDELEHYKVRLDDGSVVVNLDSPDRNYCRP